MSKIKEDIEEAYKLINGLYNANYRIYNLHRIYSFTNELFSWYKNLFEQRKSILSVIGSGDQIFNAILSGTKEVEAFDINSFAIYYFKLKKTAIEILTREEFVDMFLEHEFWKEPLYQHYFEEIICRLDSDTRCFWQYLFKQFNCNWCSLRSSIIFQGDQFLAEDAISINPYLYEDGYSKLKNLIKDAHIETKNGDILKLADSYHSKNFDLIYLSNIWSYVQWDKYSEMQKKLKLTPNGCLLAYSFNEINSPYPSNDCEKKKLSDREYVITYPRKN